MAFLQGNWY